MEAKVKDQEEELDEQAGTIQMLEQVQKKLNSAQRETLNNISDSCTALCNLKLIFDSWSPSNRSLQGRFCLYYTDTFKI